MQASEPLLSAGCLTFSYDQDEKPILQNVSFQLRKGERALLLGAERMRQKLARSLFKRSVPGSMRWGSIGHRFFIRNTSFTPDRTRRQIHRRRVSRSGPAVLHADG